jgi:hypothetical protein
MQRYFFKLIDQGEVYHDSEGQMCEDDEVARHQAGIALSEIAREVLAVDGLAHEFEIVVSNDQGDIVWTTKLDFEAVPGVGHGNS